MWDYGVNLSLSISASLCSGGLEIFHQTMRAVVLALYSRRLPGIHKHPPAEQMVLETRWRLQPIQKARSKRLTSSCGTDHVAVGHLQGNPMEQEELRMKLEIPRYCCMFET